MVQGNRGGTTVLHPTYEGPPGRDEHSQSVQKRAHGWPRGWRMLPAPLLSATMLPTPSPLRHRRVRAAPVEVGGVQPFAVSSR